MKKKNTQPPESISPILMNLNVAVFRSKISGSGEIVDVNPACLKIFGYSSKSEIKDIKVVDLYADPADRANMRDELQRKGSIQDMEIQFVRKNGDSFPGHVSSVLICDESGKPLYIDGVIEDVSELKDTVKKLEANQRELEDEQKVFYSGPVIFIKWPLDLKKPLKYISANSQDILGYDSSAFLSGKILYADIIHKEDVKIFSQEISDVLGSDQNVILVQPYRIRKKDGNDIWVQPYGYIKRDVNNDPVEIEGYIYDITEAHEFQRKMADSEIRYRGLVENSPTGILRIDLDGSIVDVNPQMVKILGSPSIEATKSFNMFSFPPLQKAGISERFREALEKQETVKFSGHYTTAWGKDVYYHTVINPVFDAQGRVIGAQANMEDTTASHVAEEAKRQMERIQLEERNIFVSAPIMIFKWNVLGSQPIQYVTDNVETILGYSVEEMLSGGVLYSDIIHPQDADRALNLASSMIENGIHDFSTAPYRLRRKDGEYIWVNDHSTIICDDEGNIKNITGIVYDTSKNIKAEETLKAIESTYREVFNGTSEAIFIHDADTFATLDVNETMLRKFECTYEQALAANLGDLSMKDNSLEEAFEYLIKARDEGPQSYEWHAKTHSGTPFWAEVNLRKATIHGETRILATIRDISQRREMENNLRDALKEQEVLTREVHHRVKNNMQVINSMLNLQAEYTQDPVLTEVFNETQNRIRSMALIHEKLFRSKSMAEVEFDNYLKTLVREVRNFYSTQATRIKFHESIDPVFMDITKAIPAGLIINELITNSLKYAFPDNREGSIWVGLSLKNDQLIEIEVRDDGVGLPQTVDFESTQTMGLRIVRILTEQLAGKMMINTDEGTSFTLSFDRLTQD